VGYAFIAISVRRELLTREKVRAVVIGLVLGNLIVQLMFRLLFGPPVDLNVKKEYPRRMTRDGRPEE
jgi:hypothetical protein